MSSRKIGQDNGQPPWLIHGVVLTVLRLRNRHGKEDACNRPEEATFFKR
ncbi:hypothetical protein [Desulfogranum japonicum]|nr:hypothetical protein [Desulfogranum japonicum]